MRIVWSARGVRILDLRGRDREVSELKVRGGKGKQFVVQAKVKELTDRGKLVEPELELVILKRASKRAVSKEKIPAQSQGKVTR